MDSNSLAATEQGPPAANANGSHIKDPNKHDIQDEICEFPSASRRRKLNPPMPSASQPQMQLPCKTKRLLIINPNATTSMTEGLMRPVMEMEDMYWNGDSGIEYAFYSAPRGPASINNEEDALESAEIVIQDLKKSCLLPQYDAFLVACYSSHPLVQYIRDELVQANLHGYVTGIFQASIPYALTLLPGCVMPGEENPASLPRKWSPEEVYPPKFYKFGIVTTGKYWEEQLAIGVHTYINTTPQGYMRFAGVAATGLNADELHTSPEEELEEKMNHALTKLMGSRNDLRVIILGCAGMAGMEELIKRDLWLRGGTKLVEEVVIVDGVTAGIALLKSLLEDTFVVKPEREYAFERRRYLEITAPTSLADSLESD